MRSFQKTAGFLKAALRSQVEPRARLTTKRAKDPLSPAIHTIGLVVMAVAILSGPGWFFSHLEDYKNPSKN